MKIRELLPHLTDEKSAENYLRSVGILKDYQTCISCSSDKLGIIRRGKYKCYTCKKEWSIKQDSWLQNTNLNFTQVILLIKLFEIGLTANKASEESGAGEKSVKAFYNLVRFRIADMEEHNLDEVNDKFLQSNVLSFAIAENESKVIIAPSDELDQYNSLIKVEKRRLQGSHSYFHYERVKKKSSQVGSGYSQFTRIDEFWRYAINQLRLYKGIHEKHLFLYLKELEFRFNNKEKVFEGIIKSMRK